MIKQKSIGWAIFALCCILYMRTAFLAPTEAELKNPRIAAKSRFFGGETDPQGLLHGLRYYILGVGFIGLLIVLEDYVSARSARKTPNKAPEPTPTAAKPPAAQ
jgi:hypothetical protein